jgi:hypothetical protein
MAAQTRYFLVSTTPGEYYGLHRIVMDPEAGAMDSEAFTYPEGETSRVWKPSSRIVGYLMQGDPRVDEVSEAEAQAAFPEAFADATLD